LLVERPRRGGFEIAKEPAVEVSGTASGFFGSALRAPLRMTVVFEDDFEGE
jgi:hypothetical protein